VADSARVKTRALGDRDEGGGRIGRLELLGAGWAREGRSLLYGLTGAAACDRARTPTVSLHLGAVAFNCTWPLLHSAAIFIFALREDSGAVEGEGREGSEGGIL
jgi:hypothetical protein